MIPTIRRTTEKGQFLIGISKEKKIMEIENEEELDKITALLEEEGIDFEIAEIEDYPEEEELTHEQEDSICDNRERWNEWNKRNHTKWVKIIYMKWNMTAYK